MYLGLTLSQLGEFDRACVAYDKAIDLDPCVADRLSSSFFVLLTTESVFSRAFVSVAVTT